MPPPTGVCGEGQEAEHLLLRRGWEGGGYTVKSTVYTVKSTVVRNCNIDVRLRNHFPH